MKKLLVLFLMLSSSLSFAAPRTVFVQLFEWPWRDIARECEIYLGAAGFSAVQISPPHEHVSVPGHPWWERYQVTSYQINSRSGNENDFRDMVQRCHKAGVQIYADVVLNHMAGLDQGQGFAGSNFQLFNYPGTYSYNDFHHCGRNGDDKIHNYEDRYELQNCMLVGLADLATESDYVRDQIAGYMNHLLDLGVDGFRLDAAKHVPARDLAAITGRLKRNAYIFQEIIYNSNEPIRYSEYTGVGDVTAYSYPYSVASAFKYKNIDNLYNIGRQLPSSDDSVVFLTNHDLERNTDQSHLLTFSGDQANYILAQVYMLAWPFGYPQAYSGYFFSNFDQGPPLDNTLHTRPILNPDGSCRQPWTCEHRRRELAAMVDFRNQTNDAFVITNWWSNGRDQMAFGRGNKGFVIINYSNNTLNQDFQTSLPEGTYCNVIANDYNVKYRICSGGFDVDSRGVLHGNLNPMSAVVLMQRATSADDVRNKRTIKPTRRKLRL